MRLQPHVPIGTVLFLAFLGRAVSGSPVYTESQLFLSGEGGYHTYRIPALAVLPTGTVLAFAEGRKNSADDDGNIDLVMRRSVDHGNSWTPMELVYEEGGLAPITIGNPTPVVDDDTGILHLLFSRNNERLFVMTTSDEGETFSEPQEITDIAQGFDFDWNRLAPGPTAGIQTTDGRLVAPIWLNAQKGVPTAYRAGILYSDDHGANWNAGHVVPVPAEMQGTNESAVVELVNGTLYLSQRANAGSPARAKSISDNGGHTWSQAVSEPGISSEMTNVKTSIVRYSTVENGGKNRILFSGPNSSSRDKLHVWMSENETATWPVRRQVYAGPAAYSELAIAKDNTILLLYENGDGAPYERLTLGRFNIEWLEEWEWPGLQNGDFEDTSGEFPNAWAPESAYRLNPGVQHPGLVAGSTTALLMPKYPVGTGVDQGQLAQTFDETVPEWEFDFYFAAADPGGEGTRSLNIGIRVPGGENPSSNQINFRVSGLGRIESHDNTLGWTTIASDVVQYSLDADGSGDYTDYAGDVLNVHRIRFVGHYDDENPNYDVMLSNAASDDVTDNVFLGLTLFSAGGPPAQGTGLFQLSLEQSGASTGDYILDNLVLNGGEASLPGDLNGDGFVGGADLDIVRSFWGQFVTAGNKLHGDPSGDGFVGGDDLDEVRANWGEGTPPAAAVPEPSVLVILAGASLYWLVQRRRNHHSRR